MRWRNHIWALGLAALLLGGAADPEKSPGEGIPMVRGEVIRDFARITFEWPENTYLDAQANGTLLTLNFDRKASPDFGRLLKSLSPYVTKAWLSKSGKTVWLKLNNSYRIRSFISGNLNGVDILDIDTRQHHTQRLAALSPKAGEAEPKTADKARAEKREAPKAEAEAKKPAAAPEEGGAKVKVFASISEDRTVLRFAWKERVAATTFIRNGTMWIVFSKPAVLDLEPVKETANALYPKITQPQYKDATIVRLPAGIYSGALVSKGADGLEWDIEQVTSPQPPLHPVHITINTEPPLPAHVFLPVEETTAPLAVQDPDVGDQLLIIPAYEAGVGVSPKRTFVEFALLETSQGMVVQKIADTAEVTTVRNGLRVGTEKGSQISQPVLATPEHKTGTAPASSKPNAAAGSALFPYELWKADASSLPREQFSALLLAISLTHDEQEANALRLRLAEMYLAEGLDSEALGVTEEIKRTSPQFYVANRVSAVAGGAEFMMNRFADAADDFSTTELQGNPEAAYWQSMLGELLGKPDQKYDYMANNDAFIRYYPPRLRQKMAIISTDRAIAHADYNIALQILDSLRQDNLLKDIEDYATYFIAKIALETGKEKEATDQLVILSRKYDDPPVRARADFALIDHALKKRAKTAAKVQAGGSPEDNALLAQLENLYLIWRGDNLELETLKIMGEMYAEQQEYPKAMRAWRDLIDDFPSTVDASESLGRMRSTFVAMFDTGTIKSLPLLDQLSLYYEFRTLTPADETGDRIINGIADRLVDMDLLEQAITLIDYRMRYLYEKEARSRAGAKLAKVLLLNHQPKRALQALQESVYGENPPELRQERDRLAARAMVELGRYTEAADLIRSDKTAEADSVRRRSWWRQKDWPKLTTAIETELKARSDVTAPVNNHDAEQVIHLAVAYDAENDAIQAQYLRDYFTPLMKDSPQAKVFDYLTEPQVPVAPESFDAVMQQVEDTKNFLHQYNPRPTLPAMPAPKTTDGQ